MSGYAIAALAVITLLAALALAIAVPPLNRVFAFFGSIVDSWRPTPSGQARPGHDRLGVGLLLLATPVAALLWYNVGAAVLALLNGSPVAILILLLVMVITPAIAVTSLLSWKNSRFEFDGRQIRQTTMLGKQYGWEKVVAATMRPPFRGPGPVYFDLSDRRIVADTGWINIRQAYEGIGHEGVQIEPWRDRATTWKGMWG